MTYVLYLEMDMGYRGQGDRGVECYNFYLTWSLRAHVDGLAQLKCN